MKSMLRWILGGLTAFIASCSGGSDDPSGAVLAVVADGADGAAGLRYHQKGERQVDLGAWDAAGTPRWWLQIHDGNGAPPSEASVAADIWAVVGHGDGGWALQGVDAANGASRWTLPLPAAADGLRGNDAVVVVWLGAEVWVVDRQSGAVRVHTEIPIAGGRHDILLRADGGVSVLDIQALTVVAPDGSRVDTVETFPNGRAAGSAVVAWSDRAETTWVRPLGGSPVSIEVEGRIRRGAGESLSGLLVLPMHVSPGNALLVGVHPSGDIAWRAPLGPVQFVSMGDGGRGRWLPFVVEVEVEGEAGRRLAWVDTESGAVMRATTPAVNAWLDPKRVVIGDSVAVYDGNTVFRTNGESQLASHVPGAKLAQFGPRIAEGGVWLVSPVLKLAPWVVLGMETVPILAWSETAD